MKIVHITNLSNNKSSGMSAIIPSHIRWQTKYANIYWYNINSKYVPPQDLKELFLSQGSYRNYSIKLLPEPFCSPDLVIFHGVYFYRYCQIANELKKDKIPYIVVPHGSLTESAIKQKALKKCIGFLFLFRRFLRKALTIQFLTDGECKASGQKWNDNYIIISNGCNIPLVKKSRYVQSGIFGAFIGRKSVYYKGLDILIEGCGKIKQVLLDHNCKIGIYGPDENGSATILNQLISKYKLEDIVILCEGVFGKEKEAVLLNSDFFILTSRTEGHPVALIEALSYGIPCFVSEGTNMADEIYKNNAGWSVIGDVSSVSNGIINMLKDTKKFNEKGNNARKLSTRYEWNVIAKVTIDKYKTIFQEYKNRNSS